MPATDEIYGERLLSALPHAARLHRTQVRKGTQIPYVAHLLAVCSLVLEDGGDEDVAIAAMFHDAVEDQGGVELAAELTATYGDRVALIVADCTDSDQEPKPPWRERKEAHLAHLEHVGDDSLLVAMADKLHNVRSILEDLEIDGNLEVFDRFKGGVEGTLWYYRSMLAIFEQRLSTSRHLPAFRDALGRVESLAEGSPKAGASSARA